MTTLKAYISAKRTENTVKLTREGLVATLFFGSMAVLLAVYPCLA